MKIGAVTMSALAATAMGIPLARAAWVDNTEIKGDLRYRFEYFDEEGKAERERERIRARLGVSSKLNDEMKVGLQLTTTESKNGNGDPVSGNQTLKDFGAKKGIFFDLAYFDWAPSALPGLKLTAGKMKNPFFLAGDYLWDHDYTPEGLALNYSVGGDVKLFANGAYHWIQERSSEDDSMMFGGQLGLNLQASDSTAITFGGSYYGFTEAEGQQVFDWQGGNNAYGNATRPVVNGSTTNSVYANGFNTVEGFAQVAFDLGIPVTVSGSYAVNTDADDDDSGFMAGIKFGQAKEPGSFEFGYDYRRLEKNVFPGAFTDSDALGGGTDGQGHKFKVVYQIMKNFQSAVSYYIDEKKLEDSHDYKRLQVDFMAKF